MILKNVSINWVFDVHYVILFTKYVYMDKSVV